MTTPIHHDILITQGQTWIYLFEHADLVSDGNGLRLHIRDHHGASLVRCALTHDGAANSRVSFVSGGVLAYLGASISTGWDLQSYRQRRWVYALERYSLSDPDDVTVLRLGDCLVNANPADESSIGTVAPFPSYDLVCLRFDIEQTLSVEQQARARANAGFPEGAIVDWGGIGGDLADQADLAAALADKSSTGHSHGNASTGAAGFMSAADKTKLDGVATGATANDTDANLRARSSHTGTQLAATISDFASAASTAAPVQSVAGRTGAVTIAVGDVSGAEATANKAQPNGYASLDSGGKVPQAQLPSIAVTEFLGEVANQSAMLALTGQKGDWCIRADTGATWVITGTDPTLLGSWTAISYPTSAVTSVAGRTGAVTLSTSDISGLGTAAAANTGDFATAAQGALADSAVQDVAATIHAATAATIADADESGFWQSAANALRKITWANIKATLKTYFDTLYQAVLVSGTNIKTVNSNSLLGSGDIAISASPGGSDTQVQFNDGGTLAGNSGFTFNKTNNTVDLGGATVTASDPVLDLSQTWNNAAAVFTALKLNVTNTGSLAGSKLFDLQVGGSSVASFWTDGRLQLGANTSISGASGTFIVNYAGYSALTVGNAVVTFDNLWSYGWGDLRVYRDAADTLAQRRTTNAQTFRVYRSYTDASNYSRWTVKWNTSTAILHAEGAGTGTDGSVAFNDAALATGATHGFLMIPSCAGTPTGTPADIPTGQAPIVYDSTNKKLCVWDGAAWVQTAALT